jgi:hypothetical protein
VKPGQKLARDYWRPGWRYRPIRHLTNEAIRQLKEEPNAVSIIYELIDVVGVEIAREIYRKVFEPFSEIKIEQTIERLFCDEGRREHPRRKIEVSDHLLLWFILREGFGGRKRGRHKGYLQRRHEYFAIKEFKERVRELHKDGWLVGKAKAQAAEEISKSSTISVERLLEGRFHRRRASRKKTKKSGTGGKPEQGSIITIGSIGKGLTLVGPPNKHCACSRSLVMF